MTRLSSLQQGISLCDAAGSALYLPSWAVGTRLSSLSSRSASFCHTFTWRQIRPPLTQPSFHSLELVRAHDKTASGLHWMGSARGLVSHAQVQLGHVEGGWLSEGALWEHLLCLGRVSPFCLHPSKPGLSIPDQAPGDFTTVGEVMAWLSQTKHSDVSCNLKQRDNLLLCNLWVGEAPLSQEAPRGCWLYWFQL